MVRGFSGSDKAVRESEVSLRTNDLSLTDKPRDVWMSYAELFVEQVVYRKRLQRLSVISLWMHKETTEFTFGVATAERRSQ